MLTASGTQERIVDVKLPESDVRYLLYLLRTRQDECRRVTENFPGYENARIVDVKVEQLKMAIAGSF